jgi:hypothetical protein
VGKLDLALVKFTSSKNYPIAKIADSRTVREGSTVYYTGFPAEKANQPRNYRFIRADITGRSQNQEGYELSYNGSALPGMSGGPVLNEEGLLIAIHGKAETKSIIIQGVERTEIVGVQGIPTEKWSGYLIAQTFTEWCQQKANLSQQTRRTVEVLLQVAKTQNCSQANQTLTNLTSLSLWKNQISDIKPLSNLTNLTSLSLGENPLVSKQCPLQPESICKF